MKFLSNWCIDVDKLPAYVDFNAEFTEQIDYQLSNMILEYEGDERLTMDMKKEFRKLVECIDKEKNILHVKYSPRHKIGRRYADMAEPKYPNGLPNPYYKKYYSALIAQPRIIKNTIFHYHNWIDIDQFKGHVSILFSIAKNIGNIDLPSYKSYLLEGNFNKIVDELDNYYNVEKAKTEDELEIMTDNEREEYFSTRIDKKDIKWLFNKTIYGGGHQQWLKDIKSGCWTQDGRNICKRKPKKVNDIKPHTIYNAFYRDTQKIIDLVYLNNEAIKNIVCKDIVGDEKLNWKRKNRVMSYFCGIIENEITFKAYKYLLDNHIIKKGFCDWGLDGITFPSPINIDLDFYINEMNEYVRKQTGLLHVKFVRKEFDKNEILWDVVVARQNIPIAKKVDDITVATIILPVDELHNDDEVLAQSSGYILNDITIVDDNEGASIIYDIIKNDFKFCLGNIFFKHNNVWINSKQKVDTHLLHFILTKTNMKKLGNGAVSKPKPYSTNVGGAKALREALYAKLIVEGEDNTLLQKFITTTRGRICFLDGVLDFTLKDTETNKKGKFYQWKDIDFEYFTPNQIERNFGDYFNNPNTEDINYLKTEIFDNLFGNDCEKALAFFSRGVAGHFEDKAWSLYIGNRNCGKGVIDCLSKNALGSYHANIASKNLLCNSNRSLKQEQPEKQMAFALDFQFARLAFSQEMPPPPKNNSIKIDGDIIKLLWSGGDPQKAKRNYDIFITEFINQSRLIIMANDCPTFTNEDALQTCIEFHSTISFKTKEEIDNMKSKGEDDMILQQYKEADPLIKDKCKTENMGNAFIMLMLLFYKENAVPFVDNIVSQENEVDDNNKGSLRKFILSMFEITHSEAEFLTTEYILNVFTVEDYGDVSTKKITLELKALGLNNKKKNGARGWFGIKRRPSPPETDEMGNIIVYDSN